MYYIVLLHSGIAWKCKTQILKTKLNNVHAAPRIGLETCDFSH